MKNVSSKYHTKIFRATQPLFVANGMPEYVHTLASEKAGDKLDEIIKNPMTVVFGKDEITDEIKEGQFILFIKIEISQEVGEDMHRESRLFREAHLAEEKKSPSYHVYISDNQQINPEDFDEDDLENMPIFKEHVIDYLVKHRDLIELVI
jgi:hypothetical protein